MFGLRADVTDADELLQMVEGSLADPDYISLNGEKQALQKYSPANFIKKYLMPENLPTEVKSNETVASLTGGQTLCEHSVSMETVAEQHVARLYQVLSAVDVRLQPALAAYQHDEHFRTVRPLIHRQPTDVVGYQNLAVRVGHSFNVCILFFHV